MKGRYITVASSNCHQRAGWVLRARVVPWYKESDDSNSSARMHDVKSQLVCFLSPEGQSYPMTVTLIPGWRGVDNTESNSAEPGSGGQLWTIRIAWQWPQHLDVIDLRHGDPALEPREREGEELGHSSYTAVYLTQYYLTDGALPCPM